MRKMADKMCKRSGNPFDYIGTIDFKDRVVRDVKFALSYSGLENEGARAYMQKADEVGEAAFKNLLGNHWGVVNKKRRIKRILWGFETHKFGKNANYASVFKVYLEFNVNLEVEEFDINKLFSHVFLRDGETGQEHALRFLLKHDILKGEVIIANSVGGIVDGIKNIRMGQTKLILMEDPVFPDEKITIETFKSLVRADIPRDIRIGRKWVQKPSNVPVIITGTFGNLSIDGKLPL